MPFYRTPSSKAGDAGVFPNRAPRPAVGKTKRDVYLHLDKKALIALCDERGIQSQKGTPIGRYQRKPYYIERLVEWDRMNPPLDDDEA